MQQPAVRAADAAFISHLRVQYAATPQVTPFEDDPKLFAHVAALGICQEVGTIHDQLTPFLSDGASGRPLSPDSMCAELIEWRGTVGVRIRSRMSQQIDVRLNGLHQLFYPRLSFDSSGAVRELVFFPESIGLIAEIQDLSLVSVRDWGFNTVFGGFDFTKPY